MKIKFCIFITLLLFSAFINCNIFDTKDSDQPLNNEKGIIFFYNIDNLNFPRDAAKIDSIGIVGEKISIKVSYSGGCKEHVFRLYVWHGFSKTNPLQAEIFLSHDARDDQCEAYLTGTYDFDLSELKNYVRTKFKGPGTIYLRIYEPNSREPYYPLPELYF